MPRTVGGRWAGVLVAVSAFLLVSMGGAIVASPLTVPLLYLAVRAEATRSGLRRAPPLVAAPTPPPGGRAAPPPAAAGAEARVWARPPPRRPATAPPLSPPPPP